MLFNTVSKRRRNDPPGALVFRLLPTSIKAWVAIVAFMQACLLLLLWHTPRGQSTVSHEKISFFHGRKARPGKSFQPDPSILVPSLPSYQWASFGITEHIFTGTWNNQPFRATVFVRLLCTADPAQRLARFVITLNRADDLHTDQQKVHAVTPRNLFKDSKLPEPYLQTSSGTKTHDFPVKVHYWEDMVNTEWQDSAITGRAPLNSSTWYTLRMAGSPYSFSLPTHSCSHIHPLFTPSGAWLALVDSMVKQRSMPTFRFLLMGHLKHHLSLGFRGMLFVCLPETVAALLQDPVVKDMVATKQLVLVPWQTALDRNIPYMMQVPGNNLLKLAAAGSTTSLAFWDLDEYLILPRHLPITHELSPGGCLSQVNDPSELEAVIPSTWTYDPAAKVPDLPQWLAYGGMAAAVRRMNYTARPYAHCNWGILCKSIINPDAEYNMHVHQMMRPPPQSVHRRPVGRDCAYLHHFFQLFRIRPIWDQWAAGPVQPLVLQDLPK